MSTTRGYASLRCWLLAALILCGAALAWARPAVLILGNDTEDLTFWALPRLLSKEYGFDIGSCKFADVVNGKVNLQQFNVVMLTGMSLPDPQAPADRIDVITASPKKFDELCARLRDYVHAGGSLYLYSAEFPVGGSKAMTEAVNTFLASFTPPMNAAIFYAELRDPPREQPQPGGFGQPYARSHTVAAHPATEGVKNWWYPVGRFCYGVITKPLRLGEGWTPLIQTSNAATALPKNEDYTDAGAPVQGTYAMYAARTYGPKGGRIILNGSESTISLYGYDYSPFANSRYEFIGMKKGIGGVPSDGLQLLVSSLKWLAAANNFGGFVPPPPPPPPAIRTPKTRSWPAPGPIPDAKYYKGIFAVKPALGGGSGTVAEYKAAAVAQGCSFMAVAGDFEQMLSAHGGNYDKTKADFTALLAACTAASDDNFLAMPALVTRDLQGNSFLQCSNSAWPQTSRLDKTQTKVVNHQGYWWLDDGAKMALRAPFRFKDGQYPSWLFSDYNSFAVRTYDFDAKNQPVLVEDKSVDPVRHDDYLQSEDQGNWLRLITMTLVTSPAQVPNIPDFTYIRAGDMTWLRNAMSPASYDLVDWTTATTGYVSEAGGPQVLNWGIDNANRETFGVFYVPGHERCRVALKVASAAGLRKITIYDHLTPIRVFAVSGTTYELQFDLPHDFRHVLIAVIEDVNGKRAMTDSVETIDNLFWQSMCGDRSNLMSGNMRLRDREGRETGFPSSGGLNKAGTIFFSTVHGGDALPGVDGSGAGGAAISYLTSFISGATDPAKSELNSLVHQINRPYESADVIVFDTPFLKRSKEYWVNVRGHFPYVDLLEPKVDARLVQYYFYKKNMDDSANAVLPSTMIAEMSITITDPEGVKLAPCVDGLSQQFAQAWNGFVKKYTVVRANGDTFTYPTWNTATNTWDNIYWSGELQPGDLLLFPDQGEGLINLTPNTPVALHMVCEPAKKWFHMCFGRSDTPQLPKGSQTFYRLLCVKLAESGAPSLAAFNTFAKDYGITGEAPAYTVTSEQGNVISTRYQLELAAKNYAWRGAIGQAQLPQRFPVKVTGLNPKWTAAKIDLANDEWFPLGVWNDGNVAITTVDTTKGPLKLLIGHPVTTTNSDVFLTVIRDPDTGITSVDVHNPTATTQTVTVTVPVASFLAGAQTQTSIVAAFSTVRVTLNRPPSNT